MTKWNAYEDSLIMQLVHWSTVEDAFETSKSRGAETAPQLLRVSQPAPRSREIHPVYMKMLIERRIALLSQPYHSA